MSGIGDVRIAVAIVNYGTAEQVLANLPGLVGELAGFASARVVIVDNASPGGDGDRLEGALATRPIAGVTLLRSPVNGGFAAGNNLAFAAIRGMAPPVDAVLLLNPDAAVRPGTVAGLVRAMLDRPRAGVVGGCLEDEAGNLLREGFLFPTIMSEFARSVRLGLAQRLWPWTAPAGEAPIRTDWVSGAAMLVRREALDEVGGMDEGYFLYYEEVDFMRRLGRLGWETWFVPSARVLHVAGSSTGIVGGLARGRMPAYWFRSWRRYFVKNHGAGYARAAAAARLLGLLLGIAQTRLRGGRYTLPDRYLSDFARHCLIGGGSDPTTVAARGGAADA